MIIRDIYIEDQQKDTLLYISRLEAKVNEIDFINKKIALRTLIVKDLFGNIYQLNDSAYNFSFIQNNLKSDTSTNQPLEWSIACKKLTLLKGAVKLNLRKDQYNYFDNIAIKTEDIFIDSSRQDFKLKHFQVNVDKKPALMNLTVEVNKKDNWIRINDFKLLSENSHIFIESGILKLPDQMKHLPFTYHANISSSKIILDELSPFIPELTNIKDAISLSGNFNGNEKSIHGKSVLIKAGQQSSLICDFNISSFTNLEKVSYNLDIQNFFSNKSDIAHILSSYFNQDTQAISAQLNILQEIEYSGIVKGDYYSLYNKGLITSKLGKIESDLTLKRNNLDDKIWMNGNLKAYPLNLDLLVQNNSVSEIAFNINAEGYFSKKEGSNFDLSGNIKHFQFNTYDLDSIDIKGNINKDQFKGRLSSFDHHLRFDFDGLITFDSLPKYDFLMTLYYIDLHHFGITKNDSAANLSCTIKADFVGTDLNNSNGEIQISDVFYFSDTSFFATDSINIKSNFTKTGKELKFYSEYAEASINGTYNLFTLVRSFKTLVNHYLPSLGISPSTPETENNISFEIIANYPHPITNLFAPEIKISPGTFVRGNFDARSLDFNLEFESNAIEFYQKKLTHINLKSFTRNNKFLINLTSKEFNYFNHSSLKNFNISSTIFNDNIETNFNWNNWLDLNYSGNINSLLTITPSSNISKPNLHLDIFPSNIIVKDTLWALSKGYIKSDSLGYTLHNIKLSNGISKIDLSGVISDNPNDSIALNVEEIRLELINMVLKNESLVFGGLLTGNTIIKDIKREKRINSNVIIKNLSLNGEIIGDTKLGIKWDNIEQQLIVDGHTSNKDFETFSFNGYIAPTKEKINIDAYFKNQPLKTIEPFLKPTFKSTKGAMNGHLKVSGNLLNPKWQGSIMVSDAKLLVGSTLVYYSLNDSIYFTNHDIVFKNIKVADRDNNNAYVNGRIWHSGFSEFFFDIKLETEKILAVDLKSKDSPYYYGTIYGSGFVNIKGNTNVLDINIVAKTENPSFIQIPLEGTGNIDENDFIEFTTPNTISQVKSIKQEEVFKIPETETIVNIRIDLNVLPNTEVQLIFDPRIGDMMRANGFAHLTIESLGPTFNMYGDYNITKGDFMFTLQNIINKRFDIMQGSSVSWSGDPINADIKLDAIYKVRKASVYDLTLDDGDKEKKVDVNTHLLMTGKLVNPTIKFSVDVPTASNLEAIDQLNSLPQEDLNKQVLSLLIANKFTALSSFQTGKVGNTTGNLTATTASELLSNQLSNWMSQISNDFDLGFVYRPGDETTTNEYEVALSTKLLNDRIIFNGNFGYSQNQTDVTKNPYTTDFQFEYKLTDKGNIRLRAFQKANNDITYNDAPYMQGIGIFYTQDFDSFSDLMQRMFKREAAMKPDDLEIKTEDIDESTQ